MTLEEGQLIEAIRKLKATASTTNATFDVSAQHHLCILATLQAQLVQCESLLYLVREVESMKKTLQTLTTRKK